MTFKPTLEKYTPVGNRVLLKVITTEKIGEVFLPKTVSDRWMPVIKEGTITSLLKVGDMALIGHLSVPPEKFDFGGEIYIQVAEHDVIGIVRGKNHESEEIFLEEETNVDFA